MEFGTCGVGDAVPGPGGCVVGVGGEMCPRVDVEILRRDHVGVAVILGEQGIDRRYHRTPARHRERPALTEVVLHVDDEERSHPLTVSAEQVALPATAVQ